MTPWERHARDNPTPPSNHEYDYLQAKSTGYGDGGLFSNLGASHRGAGRLGLRGSLFGLVFALGAAWIVFDVLHETPDDLAAAAIGAVVALVVAAKAYAVPTVKKLVDRAGWIALGLGVLYLIGRRA